MTAGSGVEHYETSGWGPLAASSGLLAAVITLVLVLAGGGASQARAAPVRPFSGPWAPFMTTCVAGPSPGQGNAPSACRCWKDRLEAVAIGAADALDILNAAQGVGGEAFMVPENIGNVSVNEAMQGCGLYRSGAS